LIPDAPEVLVGIALFIWGTFSIGWACVAGWLASCPQTRSYLGRVVGQMLFMALCCYLGSLALISVELAMA
jgi:hypothetical protein